MYFDTLTVSQNLIEAGMPDAQAKAIAKEYAHLMQHQIDQFATKGDLKHLRVDLEVKIDTRCNELDKKIDVKFNELDKKIDTRCDELDKKIDVKFTILDKRIDQLEVRMERLETRMERLEAKFEQLYLRIAVIIGGSVEQPLPVS